MIYDTLHNIASKESIKSFMFGGKALFIVVSSKTNKRIIFEVKKHKTDDVYFVSFRVFNSEYRFLGTIFNKKDFRISRKQYKLIDSQEKKAFEYLIDRLNDDKELKLTFNHVGKCGCCGRTLTDEKSIQRGFGSECYKKNKK